MSFISLSFAIFLPLVIALYHIVPNRFKRLILIAASIYFYISYDIALSAILVLVTIISYLTAIQIDRSIAKSNKKFWLISCIIICIGILFIFKYFNFFADSILRIMSVGLDEPFLKLIVPAGISFYIFQVVSYIIEVYRGNTSAEKNFEIYALFVLFFPKIITGPIERPQHLLPQLKAPQKLIYGNITSSCKIMLWGYFLKMVIADNVVIIVNNVFNDVRSFQGPIFIIAIFLYSIQIYCDFAAYSEIARGCAKLFGIELMMNFKSPYLSKSIKEFWKRWHISLSTWFMEYLYFPLGGSRTKKIKFYRNLMITFVVSGLWHGASWNFIIWGFIHGMILILENIYHNFFKSNKRELVLFGSFDHIIYTFLIASFAWIFFRANTLHDAFYVISHLFDVTLSTLSSQLSLVGIEKYFILSIGFAILLLLIDDILFYNKEIHITEWSTIPSIFQWVICIMLVIYIVIFGAYGITYNPQSFIYFQF